MHTSKTVLSDKAYVLIHMVHVQFKETFSGDKRKNINNLQRNTSC